MKIANTQELGSAIRARRKALQVTQKDLAMACGTGLRFIIELEQGKATCQTGKMLQVLQALGITCSFSDSSFIQTNESKYS